MMSNYYNAKIYKISSPQSKKYYIGSTCMDLEDRLSYHKWGYRNWLKDPKNGYCTSYEILMYGDYKIELIEKNILCKDINDVLNIERKYQLENSKEIVNAIVAGGRPRTTWINEDKIYECNCGRAFQNKYRTLWVHRHSKNHKESLIEKHVVEDILNDILIEYNDNDF